MATDLKGESTLYSIKSTALHILKWSRGTKVNSAKYIYIC